MQPIEFPEQNTVLGKDQPQYRPLPCHRVKSDPNGRIIICLKMTIRERLAMLFTGKLWHTVTTFNQHIQPQQYSIIKPQHLINLRHEATDQK